MRLPKILPAFALCGALACAAHGQATPQFSIGYSDAWAKVRVSGTSAGSGNNSYHVYSNYPTRYISVTYNVTDPEIGTFSHTIETHVWDIENNQSMAFGLPFEPDTWSYRHLQKEICFTGLGGEGYYCVADPHIVQLTTRLSDMAAAKFAAKLPSDDYILTWNSADQALFSNTAHRKYDSTRCKVETILSKVYPALPFYPSGNPFNAEHPYDPAYPEDVNFVQPRPFARVYFKNERDFYATAYVFPGKGDNLPFNNVLLVGDAFDPFNSRGALKIFTDQQYSKLLRVPGSSPRNSGYDVVFLDFSQGGGDLPMNAMLELKMAEWLKANGAPGIVIGGPSMSGIVARLAALYSMPQNNAQGSSLSGFIRGYLSIDSPHQGASISGNYQRAIHGIGNDKFIAFEAWAAGEPHPKRNWKQLSVPATHQMLYEHYYPGGNVRGSTVAHDAFYELLRTLGNHIPNVPKVAIAYGNFYVPHPGWTASPGTSYFGGYIQAPQATQYDFDARNNEFEPGSIGFWYKSTYKNKIAQFHTLWGYGSDPSWWKNETFKGTFMPIRSTLDLAPGFSVTAPTSLDEKAIAKYSPFDFVHYMQDPYNGYCTAAGVCGKLDRCRDNDCRQTQEDRRYEHLVFDEQLMEAINEGLAQIKRKRASKANTATLSLLLQ